MLSKSNNRDPGWKNTQKPYFSHLGTKIHGLVNRWKTIVLDIHSTAFACSLFPFRFFFLFLFSFPLTRSNITTPEMLQHVKSRFQVASKHHPFFVVVFPNPINSVETKLALYTNPRFLPLTIPFYL
ncbi:GQ67_00128T0 [Komagataella phaffii]|nr:GQ67_00128T0 [Komagataella phaffii]AOA67046.1 GQ68_01260T0 [Komagataella phaffii GS115]